MLKILNRIQIGLAIGSSAITMTLCITAAITASPELLAACPICGIASFIAWQMCD